MPSMIWRLAWSNGEDDYLAVGRRDNMKVWKIKDDLLVETRLRFPACTRFFYDVTVGEYTRVDRETVFDGYSLVHLRRRRTA